LTAISGSDRFLVDRAVSLLESGTFAEVGSGKILDKFHAVFISLTIMLKLSTKGQYGVRAMFEVAKNYGRGTTTIKEIAERQDVSVSYLEQLLNKLRRAGIIESVKGPGGGYVLEREPSEVSIGDILRVLEGPVAITSCLDPSADGCSRVDSCVTRMLWKSLGERIEGFLDQITLQELIQEEKRILDIPAGKGGDL